MKKIKVIFEGGLGNQLFQFAYALYLEKKYNCDVSYDVSKYSTEKVEYRDFELDSFVFPENWEREAIKKGRIKRLGVRYLFYGLFTYFYIPLRMYLKKSKNVEILDRLYQFFINMLGIHRCHFGNYSDPSCSLASTMVIFGQWIWKDMVMSIDEYLKTRIKVKTPLSESNASFLKQIETTNSVGVHIRRGDYVTLGLIACNIKYYEACIEMMNDIEKDAVFFIFSDDIPWVKENLKVNASLIFVDNNNPSPEDMRLLYNCNHFIMSNSTFSWWGAFLGNYPQKKVIVPLYWDVKDLTTESPLIAKNWIKVDNRKYL